MSRKLVYVAGALLAVTLAGGLTIGPAAAAVAQAGQAAAVAAAVETPELGLPEGPFARRPLGKFLRANLRRLLALGDELNLTGEQKAQIAGVLRQHKPEILAALKQFRDQHRKLQSAVAAVPTDEHAIRAAAAGLSKAIGDAAMVKAKVRAEVRAVLTDEQKAAVDKFRKGVQASVDQALAEAEAPSE